MSSQVSRLLLSSHVCCCGSAQGFVRSPRSRRPPSPHIVFVLLRSMPKKRKKWVQKSRSRSPSNAYGDLTTGGQDAEWLLRTRDRAELDYRTSGEPSALDGGSSTDRRRTGVVITQSEFEEVVARNPGSEQVPMEMVATMVGRHKQGQLTSLTFMRGRFVSWVCGRPTLVTPCLPSFFLSPFFVRHVWGRVEPSATVSHKWPACLF